MFLKIWSKCSTIHKLTLTLVSLKDTVLCSLAYGLLFYEYIVKGKKGIVKGLSVHFKFNLKEESPSKPNLCGNARFGIQKSRVIGIQKFLENIRFWFKKKDWCYLVNNSYLEMLDFGYKQNGVNSS